MTLQPLTEFERGAYTYKGALRKLIEAVLPDDEHEMEYDTPYNRGLIRALGCMDSVDIEKLTCDKKDA